MTVVVLGAEAYAGRHVLAALPGARAVASDADLDGGLEGAQVVVNCAPSWDAGRRLRFTREPHPVIARLLAAARRARVQRVVHLSTTLVYGADTGEARLSEATPPRPVHAFEKLKLHEEQILRAGRGDLEVVIVRAATGFGAYDELLARMLGELERGTLRLVNRGRARRGFLAGPDLGRALAAAAQRGRPGATYLADGFEGSWAELFGIAAHVLGVEPRVLGVVYDLAYLGAALRELRTPAGQECWPSLMHVDMLSKPHLYDGAATRRELVWSPQVGSFEEGVMELAAWYRSLRELPV